MTKFILLFSLVFVFNSKINAQKNDLEAGLYNVGFGALFSSIGALINKKPNEKVKDVLKNSLWQGALGGYVTFESKRMLREAQRQDKWQLIWGANIVNAMGTSIKENVSMRRSFYKYWHFNFSFNRLELSFDESPKVSYKILPVALAYNIGSMIYYEFDLKQTLRMGTFSYQVDSDLFPYYAAFALPGAAVFIKDYADNIETAVHEKVHLFQFNEFSIINSYYYNNYKSLNLEIRNFNILKLFYPDGHYLIYNPIYILEGTEERRDENFFEQEAEYYENNY